MSDKEKGGESPTDYWYDIVRVERFIKAALNGKDNSDSIATEDLHAAAYALLAVIQGRDIRKDMGIAKKRGQRGPKYKPIDFTIDKPAMGVVLEWRSGGLKYGKALEKFMKITDLKEATAKKLMAELRPRAEETIKAFDLLHAQATNTPLPKRKF